MEDFQVTTADMLEIVLSGGNGAEYVNIAGLMEKAANELREKDAENARLREALRAVVACWEVPTYGNSSDKLDIVFDAVELARAALGETNEPS